MTAATTSQTTVTVANRTTASLVNPKTIQVTVVRTTPIRTTARLATVEMMVLMSTRMDRTLLPLTQAVGLWLAVKLSNQAKK
jgi:hypothetical protein